MLKYVLNFLMIMTIAVMVTACSEDSTGPGDGDGNGDPQAGNGQIAMTIAGQNWASFIATADTTIFNNAVTGVGFGGGRINPIDGIAIAIADLSGIQEQAYTFSPGTQNLIVSAGYFNNADSTQNAIFDPQQSTGTVTITSLNFTDGNISGTFSFDLYRQFGGQLVQIRNGSFNKIPLN